jgi:hypothetical protein
VYGGACVLEKAGGWGWKVGAAIDGEESVSSVVIEAVSIPSASLTVPHHEFRWTHQPATCIPDPKFRKKTQVIGKFIQGSSTSPKKRRAAQQYWQCKNPPDVRTNVERCCWLQAWNLDHTGLVVRYRERLEESGGKSTRLALGVEDLGK